MTQKIKKRAKRSKFANGKNTELVQNLKVLMSLCRCFGVSMFSFSRKLMGDKKRRRMDTAFRKIDTQKIAKS